MTVQTDLEAPAARAALAPQAARSRRSIPTPAPGVVVGAAILIFLVLFSIVGPVIRPFGANASDGIPLSSPDAQHWLGTDDLGRDTFVRLAVAARASLAVSFFAALIAAAVGTLVGLVAGLWGRWVDAGVMAIVELMLAIPSILLALCAVTVFGGSVATVTLVLALTAVPQFARLVRSRALELRELDFVHSAKVSGVSTFRVALRHLLPNTVSIVAVQFANTAAISILLEASLSYLGLSVQPPTPSWGRMIYDAQNYMAGDPWLAIAPLLAILALSIGWGLVGESIATRRRSLI